MLNNQRVSCFFEGTPPSTQAGFISPRLAGCQVLSHPCVWADVQCPTNSHSVGQNLKNETHFFLKPHVSSSLYLSIWLNFISSHLALTSYLISSSLLLSHLISSCHVCFLTIFLILQNLVLYLDVEI
jgi:hypothetical protein